jgi:hypothetical protein
MRIDVVAIDLVSSNSISPDLVADFGWQTEEWGDD